jgi:hypothetical protein
MWVRESVRIRPLSSLPPTSCLSLCLATLPPPPNPDPDPLSFAPPPKSAVIAHLTAWWDRTGAAAARERRALIQLALRAPDDVVAQHAAVCGLESLNSAYLADATALTFIAHTALLTPSQLAEAYLASWPHLPLVPDIFEGVGRLAAAQAAAAAEQRQQLAAAAQLAAAQLQQRTSGGGQPQPAASQQQQQQQQQATSQQ